MSTLEVKYLFQCKANYYKKIRPARKESYVDDGYKALVCIAKEYFKQQREDEFVCFFQEYQYCVNLWTAHLIIEYGKPNNKFKKKGLEIIERYSETPLNEELAREEKEWLERYLRNSGNG